MKFCTERLDHRLFRTQDKNDIVNIINFNEDYGLKCLLCFICICLMLYFHRHIVKITWTLQILRLANQKSYLRQRTMFKYMRLCIMIMKQSQKTNRSIVPHTFLYQCATLGIVSKRCPLHNRKGQTKAAIWHYYCWSSSY